MGTVEAVDKRGAISGLNILSGANSSAYGVGFIKLKNQTERVPRKKYRRGIGGDQWKNENDQRSERFYISTTDRTGFWKHQWIRSDCAGQKRGTADNSGPGNQWVLLELYKRPEIAFAFTSFNTNNPQYLLKIDNEKAKQLNVSVANILGTMQVYFGSSFVSDFNRFGKYYRVIVEADVPYRKDPTFTGWNLCKEYQQVR